MRNLERYLSSFEDRPISCLSRTVFNERMFKDPKRPKTMWRITSNGDAIVTWLPELGDNTRLHSCSSELDSLRNSSLQDELHIR